MALYTSLMLARKTLCSNFTRVMTLPTRDYGKKLPDFDFEAIFGKIEEDRSKLDDLKDLDMISSLSLNNDNMALECRNLRQQNAHLNGRCKMLSAENELILKRCKKQVADARKFGIQQFCKDIVEVADALHSATASIHKFKYEGLGRNRHFQSVFSGLVLTHKCLLQVFRRHGIESFNPINEKFDPNFHEALFARVNSSVEPNTVIEVTKLGYRWKDRCIRPALVGVSKPP